MPKISVIIPVYKVEDYLDRCVKSVIEQTYRDYEIILVDDESPDSCGDICDYYAEHYEYISVIHKKNQGLGYARNTGIEAAKGDYITFVDSDDYISKDMLEDLMNAVNKNNADTVIAGYSRSIGDVITPIKNPLENNIYINNSIINEIMIKMLGPLGDGSDVVNMAAWRVLYSMSIIKMHKLRYPSEREYISEDIIFDIQYYQFAKCVCGIENCGYIYCLNPGSLTERYNPDRYIKGELLFQKKKLMLEEADLYKGDAKYRTEESYLRYSRYAIKSEVKFTKVNGKKSAIRNIIKISNSVLLRQMIEMHSNHQKTLIDKLIDYLILKRKARIIYLILTIGYRIRGNNNL